MTIVLSWVVDEKGCHICTSHNRNDRGYPMFCRQGKYQKVSRYLYKQKHEIPKGYHVLHKCDTPACINLEHLFLGTNDENVLDKVKKNRQFKKLKREDIIFLYLNLQRIQQKTIAKILNISASHISHIMRGDHLLLYAYDY